MNTTTLHKLFSDGLAEHIQGSIEKANYNHKECIANWGFDAGQIVRRMGFTNTYGYFRYCGVLNFCPTRLMIYLMRKTITRSELIAYVNEVYDKEETVVDGHNGDNSYPTDQGMN